MLKYDYNCQGCKQPSSMVRKDFGAVIEPIEAQQWNPLLQDILRLDLAGVSYPEAI